MTIGLLILEALTLTGAGVLLYVKERGFRLERQEMRRLEQAAKDTHVIELRTRDDVHRRELTRLFADHRKEVAVLCQRIQAPEQAIIEHQQDHGEDAAMVLPLSDVESAERAKALEAAVEHLEAVEARAEALR